VIRPLLLAASILAPALALAQGIERVKPPAGASLYFISPVHGQEVTSPVTVRFGLHGMGVAPAGVEFPDSGHHHLLIDVDLPPLDQPIPNDEKHRHFGGGQTEVTLALPPGSHTLQLLLADHRHIPHDPPVLSERITITVK
jgi:hypothetical protein